jgi:hypothetical protein
MAKLELVKHRLQILKDVDPFNKQLLNDCLKTIKELEKEIESLRKQLNIQTV